MGDETPEEMIARLEEEARSGGVPPFRVVISDEPLPRGWFWRAFMRWHAERLRQRMWLHWMELAGRVIGPLDEERATDAEKPLDPAQGGTEGQSTGEP